MSVLVNLHVLEKNLTNTRCLSTQKNGLHPSGCNPFWF
ncbi:MAG: hypothetical protein ACI8WI_001579 [Pseudoalteromonas distincta]